MKGRKPMQVISCMLALGLMLSGCGTQPSATGAAIPSGSRQTSSLAASGTPEKIGADEPDSDPSGEYGPVQTGLIAEQILDGAGGQIHYSYYLPEGYDPAGAYPMMMVMPGYDMMWFGESSSGRNLDWRGFRVWTALDEDMIVVSAQLTDWGETSARQAVELTEYFIQNFGVDESRVYGAGYSAGGETMSRAVSMRPDLYAAYLHGASQWDGTYGPVAEEQVAVYIFMAENDEYYGSQKARDAYDGLYAAYQERGLSDGEIQPLLQVETPDNDWFRTRGIQGNYHGGGNVLFDEQRILDWIVSRRKPQGADEPNTDASLDRCFPASPCSHKTLYLSSHFPHNFPLA